ncbi:proline hydroxylase [Leisingera sp. ANG-M1]|uniref:2OG-Fe(II) oxygenase n=1 Tax=Leisingera sp. ANG-M1 TaxID=1577895 RepID=UPI0005803A02|nr:2OG-Fe(II) oxygenase [Leisingera sp. ANG-M1]KIC08800.1 proline hydroxylase [Leisingera sp. ANG-M1]
MAKRVSDIDWAQAAADLDARGYADLGALLPDGAAAELIANYGSSPLYRSHIRMARHGFGQGEYKYFTHPLPGVIAELRRDLYPPLARIANTWNARLNADGRFPETHAAFLDECHAAGQMRPTPLILRYGPGDFNCLHQDVYGAHLFPLQVVFLLSQETDFDGGEFVMTEQRPRMQSRAEVVPLRSGHGYAFAVNDRPKQGVKGYYRVKHRHGVSEIRAGERYAMGIIFHDAA